jgi:DNA invertase Pin-like site-specific DNA recombinase
MAKCTDRPRPLALGYVRVSTEEQATEGASIEAQRVILAAEAERRGWDLELVADEGLSAKNLDRPGLADALDRLDRGGADTLLAVRVDRLSRSVADFAGLMVRAERCRWSLVALDLGVDTTTPAGDLMANVLASVAQYERKVIGQRTREGMAQRKAEGIHVGRPRVLPVDLVARIVRERAAGATLRAIAEGLTAEGIPTARGRAAWSTSTIQGVLASTTAQQLGGVAGDAQGDGA